MATIQEIVLDVLQEWGQEVIEESKDRLRGAKAVASKNLLQSITPLPFTTSTGVGYEINFGGADYWIYVDKGVDGIIVKRGSPYSFKSLVPSKKHIAAIKKWAFQKTPEFGKPDLSQIYQQWAQSKQIKIGSKALGNQDKMRERGAALVAAGIKRSGIRATKFWTATYTDAKVNDLIQRLSDATGQNIIEEI